MTPLPPQSELHRALEYFPETGLFIWRHRPEMGARWNTRYAGRQAGSLRASDPPVWVISYKRNGRKFQYVAHRIAWAYVHGDFPADVILDHININPLDNRIANLRIATREGNGANRHRLSSNTSGYKGVTYRKRDRKWYACVGVGSSKKRHLGSFDTAEEAHAAYVEAAIKQYGEFARAA